MAKKNKVLKSKTVTYLLLPVFFLFIWFGLNLTFILNYDYSPSVISFQQTTKDSNIFPKMSQTKITGTFKAAHNYLGLIVLKFDKTKTTYDKFVIFRLKEQGASTWHKQSREKTNDFHYLDEFPLGFPIIENSEGKTYVFEIELVKKNKYNSIGLLQQDNVLLSKYQFPKEKLLNDTSLMKNFAFNKIQFLFKNTPYPYYSVLYLLPFLCYIIFLLFYDEYLHPLKEKYLDKYISRYNYPGLFVNAILIYTDIIFIPKRHTSLTITLILLFMYNLYRYRFQSKVTYVLMMSLLAIGFLAFITGISVVSEKAAAWICILLILAVPQMIRETV